MAELIVVFFFLAVIAYLWLGVWVIAQLGAHLLRRVMPPNDRHTPPNRSS